MVEGEICDSLDNLAVWNFASFSMDEVRYK